METEKAIIEVDADTSRAMRSLEGLNKVAKAFGEGLGKALTDAIVKGRELDDVFKDLALSISNQALAEGLKPLEEGVTKFLQGSLSAGAGGGGQQGSSGDFLSSLFSAFGGAQSASVPFPEPKPSPVPFARGGVVSAPSFFPLNSGFGVAGEAGSEAILPLKRGSDGRLGVGTSGGERGVSVTVNIATPNAQSFRQSEAQVTSALARAVSRAQRNI